MFEHLEWNNLETIFKENAKNCKHYYPTFSNGKLELSKVGYKIFEKVLNQHLGSNLKNYSSLNKAKEFVTQTKDGQQITSEEIENLSFGSSCEVCGNSNRFDLVILNDAYSKNFMFIPWDFRK